MTSVRLDAERRDRLGRLDVVLHRELREVVLAVEAGVDDRDAAVDALQHPDHHRDVHAPRSIGAGDQARDGEVRERRKADGVDLVAVHVGAKREARRVRARGAQHPPDPPRHPAHPAPPAHPRPPTRPLCNALRRSTLPTMRLRQLGAELDLRRHLVRRQRARGRTRAGPPPIPCCPARSTTHAFTTSPLVASGMPATPTSATAGCVASASSISRGHTW